MILLKFLWHINAFIKIIFYKMIFGKKIKWGKHVTFRENFSLVVDGGKVVIGNNVFFNNNCSIVSHKSIIIGENCIFGEGVKIYDHNHKFAKYNVEKKYQGFSSSEIKIGKNCWLANNVIILKGAEIGDNSVIGAGCVIKNKIPANVIVSLSGDYNIQKIRYR
ncbi:acyltransferase [Megamonas hypermegale]|uniref:acyltransferase n=1 Tax=Megamonas hypermegale TaxID=158847 RepID=UPI0026E933D2|nr:acyltransferase [Megamonas hypermegale]